MNERWRGYKLSRWRCDFGRAASTGKHGENEKRHFLWKNDFAVAAFSLRPPVQYFLSVNREMLNDPK